MTTRENRKPPSLLIIGAMKSGTTSLYRDLSAHPLIEFPVDKEPGNLADPVVLSEAGLRDYLSLWQPSRDEVQLADGSTAYSKLPLVEGVPERAKVVAPDARIIYLVRHPIERALSHHRHLVARRKAPRQFDEALKERSELIDFGRYGMQIAAWFDAFPASAIRVVPFERYVADRQGLLAELLRFVRVPPQFVSTEPDCAANVSVSERPATGIWGVLRSTRVYRDFIRPKLSLGQRQRVRRILLAAPDVRVEPPSPDTRKRMEAYFQPDVAELCKLLGWSESPWGDGSSLLGA